MEHVVSMSVGTYDNVSYFDFSQYWLWSCRNSYKLCISNYYGLLLSHTLRVFRDLPIVSFLTVSVCFKESMLSIFCRNVYRYVSECPIHTVRRQVWISNIGLWWTAPLESTLWTLYPLESGISTFLTLYHLENLFSKLSTL